jgi:hypothetical protein
VLGCHARIHNRSGRRTKTDALDTFAILLQLGVTIKPRDELRGCQPPELLLVNSKVDGCALVTSSEAGGFTASLGAFPASSPDSI